ncbi:MAG: CDP-diacylglycerol diphosphatase [Caulobacteraceae bacterium]
MNRRVYGAGRRALRETLRLGAILLLAACKGASADAAAPDALWFVVHDVCGADMRLTGHALPCLSYNSTYSIVKDPGSPQLLVVPTRRLTGIESPELLAPDSPNYWQAAWQTRSLFEKRAHRPIPRNAFGLAINSLPGRTQNQLHIHIDCVKPEIIQALNDSLAQVGPQWADLDVPLRGRFYHAMLIKGEDLGARDPFKLLAEGDPLAAADMGQQTLAVIGVTLPSGAPAFVLLARHANMAVGDKGAAESLLDHTCSVLHEAQP